MSNFDCERTFIEHIYRPIQRNVLIAEYCNERFEYVNLVDAYYRKVDSNAIFMFLIICITFPVLFMAISAIAEKYLSVGMQDLSKRFKMSPSIAATTLIAFANGAPDVLASLSSAGGSGGAFIGIGALFGAFIFTSTLVVANILFSVSSDIVMPRLAVIKELSFYSISVLVVIIFGLIGSSGFPFVFTYLAIYCVYIFATIKVDKMSDSVPESEGSDKPLDLENNNDKADEEQLEIQEAADEEGKNQGKLGELMAELIDPEAGFYQNAVLMPLMFSGLFTISYLENPLMKTPVKLLVIPMAFTFTIFILELTEASILTLFLIGLGIALICFGFEMFNIQKELFETIYEIIAVFAAIGWIKIFSTLIVDFITFLAFYFSISEVVLATLLLSAGNSLGDLFGNAALALQGETVMASMACYSGQIFNNFVGLTANIAMAAKSGETEFDIFGLREPAEKKIWGLMPINNLFVTVVLMFVISILVVSFMMYFGNGFVLKKKFSSMLFGIYISFFVFSIAFALIFRGA